VTPRFSREAPRQGPGPTGPGALSAHPRRPSRYAPSADGACAVTRPGAAPASLSAADISALPPESVGRGSLVTEDHREVSPLSRGMMLPAGSTPVRPATGRPSLAPGSFTRSPIGAPCGALSLAGGLRAYHVPHRYPGGLGRASRPVARHLRQRNAEAPAPGHVPFGPSLSAPYASVLACRTSRPLPALHLKLTLPPTPGPRPPCGAGSRGFGSRLRRQPCG